MKRLIYCLLMIWGVLPAAGQENLVPNPSFELYDKLPTAHGQLDRVLYWFNPNTVKSGFDRTTPDFLHEAAEGPMKLPHSIYGDITPKEGKGVAALVTYVDRPEKKDHREYMSVRLRKPLKPGWTYEVTFYYSNSQGRHFCTLGSNNLGVMFSRYKPEQDGQTYMKANPQYEIKEIVYANEWRKASFHFVADEQYFYLTLGNFRNDHHTFFNHFKQAFDVRYAYYFIDKVSVRVVDRPDSDQYFNNRAIDMQAKFRLQSDTLLIKVFDERTDDEDTISLFFNGECIIDRKPVTHKPITFRLPVKRYEKNKLLLHAHNLGRIPPNTAIVHVIDGRRTLKFALTSTRAESGMVEFLPPWWFWLKFW